MRRSAFEPDSVSRRSIGPEQTGQTPPRWACMENGAPSPPLLTTLMTSE